MRRLVVTTLFLAVSAVAQQPTKAAKAEELLRLANVEGLTNQLMNQVWDQVKGNMLKELLNANFTPDQQKVFDDFTAKVQKLVSGAVSFDSLKPDYIKLYSDAFDEEEIDGMLAFYRSPAGKAMVAKQPTLLAKAGAISQQHMAAVLPELQKLMQEFEAKAKELRK